MANTTNMEGERFVLQPSQDNGYWVATDTEHGIVLKFREHYLNADQKVTMLNGETFATIEEATRVATYLRELSDWLAVNHRELCQPTKQSRLNEMGAHIKELRAKKGMTIEQMARTTGVSMTNISNIENGKQAATLDTLYRIAYALDAKIDIIPV